MARGKPLSAAHKAAISAGLKRYWASRSGGSSSGGSSKRSSPVSFIPGPFPKTVPAKSRGKSGSSKPPVIDKIGAPKPIMNISTGKPISREEAAKIMFGTKGAAKKKAAGRKVKR